MKRKQGAVLTAVLVDYDNIYLALKRKSDEAAKRFAKDATLWLKEIESGRLITPTGSHPTNIPRRIVLNRCYGNPVPRRNTHDNSTDMSSFPFVRHHFLRSGFEVIDCPPLTAQQKNAADIRMVMDVRDFLQHETYFDEFIILSGDADFTPVMHRLRAHARRTVIFANDHTAAPYTAISDGEVREQDLLTLLLEGRIGAGEAATQIASAKPNLAVIRGEIIAEVVAAVGASSHPIPLEALADRAVRLIGHDKTTATGWAGAGSFRELLAQELPKHLKLSEQPPYFVIDPQRQLAKGAAQAAIAAPIPAAPAPAQQIQQAVPAPIAQPIGRTGLSIEWPSEPRTASPAPAPALAPTAPAHPQRGAHFGGVELRAGQTLGSIPTSTAPIGRTAPQAPEAGGLPSFSDTLAQPTGLQRAPLHAPVPQPASMPAAPFTAGNALQPTQTAPAPIRQPIAASAPPAPQPATRQAEAATALQQSIARIHEACQAPPLSPPEYRLLFELSAREISERGLAGAQTITNIAQRGQELGLDIRRDDVRFVLEVVSEADPWFEQGASANVFAGRFRNFVVARCRSQGLNLSADELDLIEAWFVSGSVHQQSSPQPAQPPLQQQRAPIQQPGAAPAGFADYAQQGSPDAQSGEDDFPRFVRNRVHG